MMQEINPTYRYHKLWLAIGYALIALVIFLSVTSKPPLPDIDIPFIDKVGHLLAYFSMMAWFAQIYHAKKQRLSYALSFVALGVVMEFVQSFDPARMAEFADMVANASGVLIALLMTRMSFFRQLLLRIESLI
jgi:VanZ family protein